MLLFVQINQIIRCRLHSAEALRNQICSVYTDQQAGITDSGAGTNKNSVYDHVLESVNINDD